MRVGPKLRQLVADIDACSSSPEALQKLKQLQFLPRRAVEAEVSETVQCIERVLQQATSGSVRNISRCLFTISKVAQAHPPLLRALQSDAYKATVSGMFQACAADGGLYRRAVAVSQLCSAQYNLEMYCEEFWHNVSEKHIAAWDAQAASNVVYSYGKLHSVNAAPDASAGLRQLLRATVSHHARELAPKGVANVAWAFAKQEIHFGDALLPLQEAASHTATEMSAQNVANSLWALATLSLDLGVAREPLMHAIVRVADTMSAQEVANSLWALATLSLDLGPAREPLMQATVRVADTMTEQGVANSL